MDIRPTEGLDMADGVLCYNIASFPNLNSESPPNHESGDAIIGSGPSKQERLRTACMVG